MLRLHARRFRGAAAAVGVLHVDVHGRRDSIASAEPGGPADVSDCDIGTGAMCEMREGDAPLGRALAAALRRLLEDALEVPRRAPLSAPVSAPTPASSSAPSAPRPVP